MITRRDLLALPALGLVSRFALGADDEDPTRVFTDGRKPTDVRLGPPKTLNGDFPFHVPKTKDLWETRRQQLREQLFVATGLWPLPEKTPLNPVIHGKIEKDGYSIEKVYFASTPGHSVTGNLYRPLRSPNASPARKVGEAGPAVLFAHGHWANGRFHDAGEKAAEASVKSGSEPDLDRGRFFMQAIPITLARMGFVVFQYDMIGYADSLAIPHRTGFTDADAELRLQSFMGLQAWNSIRALDFLSSLPDVDAKRIGMTGASGGGTQTFLLAAMDDRLAAAFPAVMVSTAMQGGCVCENCSLLRINTGNVEFAAMFAPKPLALSAANDWTKEMMSKGYPELKELYSLYKAEEKVAAKAWLEYGHQYNVHAREFMYAWFAKHLQGKDGPVKEASFKPTPAKELSVFDTEHPRPKDERDAAKLREAMAKASDAQMAKLTPKDAVSLKEFQRVVGTALQAITNEHAPAKLAIRQGPFESKHDGIVMHRAVLGREGEQDAIPCAGLIGKKFDGAAVAIWAHPLGKTSLMQKGKPVPAVQALLDEGIAVVATDLLGTGEQVPEKPFTVDKGYAGFTFGYNRSLLANRVHDLLTLVSFTGFLKAKQVSLIGFGEMGPVAILARALAGMSVQKVAADLNQFRFENIKDTADPMMLPGAVKYGGMSAFLALCAPGAVLAHNHAGTASGKLSKAAYEAAGVPDHLTRINEKLDDLKVVEWLLK